MENNQSELQEEEIPNIEQFQVGRVPSADEDHQTDTQNIAEDDDVELGFTEEEPDGEEQDGTEDVDDDDEAGEPGDENADFENPEDDPA